MKNSRKPSSYKTALWYSARHLHRVSVHDWSTSTT